MQELHLEKQQAAERLRTGKVILCSKLRGIPNGCRGKLPPVLGGKNQK